MTNVRVERLERDAFWRVTLAGSKPHVIDMALMAELLDVFHEAGRAQGLKAMALRGEGEHFSYGVSIEEHLPDRVAAMLASFHGLLFALLESSVFTMAAVRGHCLGGGLELASLCHRVLASPEARLGQPEITLGVFAPVASVVLEGRVGRGSAADLCLSGRLVSAGEAATLGLVDEVVDDPDERALAYAREHLFPKSASSLRLAAKAARLGFESRLRAELPAIERLYLDELMKTEDAVEGLRAFLSKRPPRWENR